MFENSNKICYNTLIRFLKQTNKRRQIMYQQIKYLKWVKCFRCGLIIAVQVGDAIPLGACIKCPRCSAQRQLIGRSFIEPKDLPPEFKEEVMKSIGVLPQK